MQSIIRSVFIWEGEPNVLTPSLSPLSTLRGVSPPGSGPWGTRQNMGVQPSLRGRQGHLGHTAAAAGHGGMDDDPGEEGGSISDEMNITLEACESWGLALDALIMQRGEE